MQHGSLTLQQWIGVISDRVVAKSGNVTQTDSIHGHNIPGITWLHDQNPLFKIGSDRSYFRCSTCPRTFTQEKAAQAHIAHNIKCCRKRQRRCIIDTDGYQLASDDAYNNYAQALRMTFHNACFLLRDSYLFATYYSFFDTWAHEIARVRSNEEQSFTGAHYSLLKINVKLMKQMGVDCDLCQPMSYIVEQKLRAMHVELYDNALFENGTEEPEELSAGFISTEELKNLPAALITPPPLPHSRTGATNEKEDAKKNILPGKTRSLRLRNKPLVIPMCCTRCGRLGVRDDDYKFRRVDGFYSDEIVCDECLLAE